MFVRIALALMLISFCGGSAVATPPDPFSLSAEYYYSKYDYKQAYQLWGEVLNRQPSNLHALFRVCEMKVLFEGRMSCRDLALKFLETQGPTLGGEGRRSVREKIDEVSKVFLTDRGQSFFLQALAKTRKKDCNSAFPLLTQAASLEKGNVRILKEKLRCEKSSSLLDAFYETTKLAYESDPYDSEVAENLIELYIYHQEFDKIVALQKRDVDAPRSPRQRLAAAVAQYEKGNLKESLAGLQAILDQEKPGNIHPEVWFTIGRIYAKKPELASEASTYLERFLSSMTRPEKLLIDGWDPYRAGEQGAEAKKLLVMLNPRE